MAKNAWSTNNENSRTEFYIWTVNSPRVKGKLMLKSNPMVACRVVKTGIGRFAALGNSGDAYYYQNVSRIVNHHCDAYGQAFKRFKQRAWNGSQVQTLVSLAESRQSLAMVTSLAGRLVTGARLIRKGKFGAAARYFQLADVPSGASASRQFLDNWMAYRYGWVPTVSDLYNHADAIANPPKDSYVVARGSGSWSDHNAPYSGYLSTGRGRVTIKARVVVSNPVLARLNQFGVLNPLEVAWELVPLSFVVDWFVGVGDYLSNLSAFVGLTLEDCSVTYAIKSNCRHPDYPGVYNYAFVGKQRVVTNVLSPPPIMMGSGLNPKRAMDSLAVLQHLIRGR